MRGLLGCKSALMGIYVGLAAELSPLGIGVTMIEPGLVRFGFRKLNAVSEARIRNCDAS